MEGRWRDVATAALLACAAAAAIGCGSEGPGGRPEGIATKDPEATFAPLVLLDRAEPWRPMGARWFIERSTFGFAEDQGCADREIAVGHTLAERRDARINWIFPRGLGGRGDSAYYRNPHDASCELNFDLRFNANEHTRPHGGPGRPRGLRPGEGYFLDLTDAARSGPRRLRDATVYSELRDEGDGGVRLTYWMLFGMHAPEGRGQAHEGDWERFDVLLRETDEGRFELRAVQLGAPGHEIPWRSLRRAGGSHPIITAKLGTHALVAEPSGAARSRWQTWTRLADLRSQPWYGFGGAWGEPGARSATTGPLGPHGPWPPDLDD